MDVLEALKSEGNALFQQQLFVEAVKVYSSVLDKLQDLKDNDEVATRLEVAVRLNRAWAWIQMPSNESTLRSAEQDCSDVIKLDPSCVKAYYRRALARERRGQWKTAMDDVVAMRKLEPGHPSVDPLLTRLQQRTLGNDSVDSDSIDTSATLEDSWEALQAVEISLQKSMTKARYKPKRKQNDKRTIGGVSKGEISEKTDELWESLRREEISTLKKAFPQAKKDTRRAG
ncbi:hypothetical protein DVH05_013872 [Phytophthora capsici]|nr:hypothetical protein DVH05_013872 [Phytophthora capsici]